jgi:hypothetical protein
MLSAWPRLYEFILTYGLSSMVHHHSWSTLDGSNMGLKIGIYTVATVEFLIAPEIGSKFCSRS